MAKNLGKFRIITNGHTYKIQCRYSILFIKKWQTLGNGIPWKESEFNTLEEAQKVLEELQLEQKIKNLVWKPIEGE